jgi:omega-amidase
MNSKKIKIGAFQFSPCNDIGKNLEAIKRGIELASEKNVRLLLTQECALCGYPPVEIPSVDSINQIDQQEALKEISLLSQKYNMFIALGIVSFIDNCVYNSVQLISPENTEYNSYNKRALWGWDKDNFTQGNEIGVYIIDGINVGIRICFEVRFPEYFRELFRNKVDLCLISFTDIGKPEQKGKLNIIQSHLISRATENVMYVLSANSISQYQLAPTCLINPDGIILEMAPLNQESLITREIEILPPDFGQEGRISNSKILQGMDIY